MPAPERIGLTNVRVGVSATRLSKLTKIMNSLLNRNKKLNNKLGIFSGWKEWREVGESLKIYIRYK